MNSISKVSVWNRTLTKEETEALYNDGEWNKSFLIFCDFCKSPIKNDDENHFQEIHSSIDLV